MSGTTERVRRDPTRSDIDLRGLSGLPTRLALATVTMTRLWWFVLFVSLPLAVLLGSLLVDSRFANGAVPICGFLALTLWSVGYYQFSRTRLRVDAATRTLTLGHGDDGGSSRREYVIDLQSVASVSAYQFGGVALVSMTRRNVGLSERFATPSTFVVPKDRLPEVLRAVDATGVSVADTPSNDDSTTGVRFRTPGERFVVTLLVLAGAPVFALVAFGPATLVTNGSVVVLLLGLLALAQEVLAGS